MARISADASVPRRSRSNPLNLTNKENRNGNRYSRRQSRQRRRQSSQSGRRAPDFSLTGKDLKDVGLKDFAGKRKVLNIVPSLDTPICATVNAQIQREGRQP